MLDVLDAVKAVVEKLGGYVEKLDGHLDRAIIAPLASGAQTRRPSKGVEFVARFPRMADMEVQITMKQQGPLIRAHMAF